jgi:hypothetical protein
VDESSLPRIRRTGLSATPEREVLNRLEGLGEQEAGHAGAVVVAVGTPERRKLIAVPALGPLAQPVGAVAGCADLRIYLTAVREIGGAPGSLTFKAPAR